MLRFMAGSVATDFDSRRQRAPMPSGVNRANTFVVSFDIGMAIEKRSTHVAGNYINTSDHGILSPE